MKRPRRISDKQALHFKSMREAGMSDREIARRTGFDKKSVKRAIDRITHGHCRRDTRAAGQKTAEVIAAVAELRPAGVMGEAGTPVWFLLNALSYRARSRRGGGSSAVGVPTIESASVAATPQRRDGSMHMNGSKLLASVGVEIADRELRDVACFALGEKAACTRIREILDSDIARSRPFSAVRLALESKIAPAEVLQMLSAMPEECSDSERAGDA